MKHLLQHLVTGQPLSREQAVEAFELIMTAPPDGATPSQIGAALALIQARGPTVDEMVGAATVMRAKVNRVRVPDGLTVADTCGVGGTHSTFFNVSTTAAIVAASVGRPRGVVVAKHGNRSITSRSGSSQLLEALGVNVHASGETLTRCLDEAGICFCFAPAHHPAMKHAAPVRQELGIRTIFNFLGPLTNPAGATRQLIGVPTRPLTRLFAEVLRELGTERALVVHSTTSDGLTLGELTCFGDNCAVELRAGEIRETRIDAEALGLPRSTPADITIDGPEASADVVRRVFAGEPGPAADTVRLNAAAALLIADLVDDLREGLDVAAAAIADGRARATLDKLVAITRADTRPA